jgi:hypothetical protein
MPTPPLQIIQIPPPHIKYTLLKRLFKRLAWVLLILFALTEGLNLLLPLLPVNNFICRKIEQEVSHQTGLRFSVKTFRFQWHLWQGIRTQLTGLQVLPTAVTTKLLPWQLTVRQLTVGVDVIALVFNGGTYALQRIELEQPALQFNGIAGVNTFIKTVDILTKKPPPPHTPRWVNQLALEASQAAVTLTPIQPKHQTPLPNLLLVIPHVQANFQQATKTDPILLQFNSLQTQWFTQSHQYRKPLGSLQATARFRFELPNPNEPNSTNWQQFWHFFQALKIVNVASSIPSVSTVVTTLHQLSILPSNPFQSTRIDAQPFSVKARIQQHANHQWQLSTTGATVLHLPEYLSSTLKNKQHRIQWEAITQVDKLTAQHARFRVDKAIFTHPYSHASIATKGSIALKDTVFNTPNTAVLGQLPIQIQAWGKLPNLQLLPPLFKQVTIPATPQTQPIQLRLKTGAFTFSNLLLKGCVKSPQIQSLTANIHRLTLQASTPHKLSPVVTTNGRIAWQQSGQVAGQLQSSFNAKRQEEAVTLSLSRKNNPSIPIQLVLEAPSLHSVTVMAWQPFGQDIVKPLLAKIPAFQWHNLSWGGVAQLYAQGTIHPTTQAFTLHRVQGGFKQWQTLLHKQPLVLVNGLWQWQPVQGFQPQLTVSLPNAIRQPWVTIGGRWHLHPSKHSGISLTTTPYAMDTLIHQVLLPVNQFLLPKNRPLVTMAQISQVLHQPLVQPWLSASIASQTTITPQALMLHQLRVDKLVNTGQLALQATVPWQALGGHSVSSDTRISAQWHHIPLEPIALGVQTNLISHYKVSSPVNLQHLTGTTNGTLTWQGQLPKQLALNTPQQLAWLRSLVGRVQVSNISGRITQHPLPFTLTPLTFKLQGLEVQPIKPVQFNWGPLQVSGIVALNTDKAQQRWLPNIALTLAPIPLATVQNQRSFYEPFFKQFAVAYPTLWRTEGSVAGQLEWQPVRKSPNAQLYLSNAGFYVPRTFAPIHGVTATFKVDLLQRTLTLPHPLFVQLGNSTILVPWLTLKNNNNQWHLGLQAQGRLHPRELNSLLGNNWYFQPTQYPWLADSWLGLKAQWGGNEQKNPPQVEANLSSVLQAEGDTHNKVVASPLAAETTATALLSTTEYDKTAPLSLATSLQNVTSLSVLQPSKLASISIKQPATPTLVRGIPKLITVVESSKTLLPNQPDEVVWYQQLGKTEPLKELARYPLSKTTQPLGTLALRFKGNLTQPQLQLGELRLLGRSEPLRFSASLDAPTQPHHLWSNQGRIWTEAPLALGSLATHTNNPTFQFESGTVQTNLHWQQADANPVGQLQLQGVQSKGLGLDNLDANAQFNPAQLVLTIPQFKAGGSDVSLQGTALLPQPFPVSFDTLNVTGKTFYVEGFLALLAQLTNTVVAPYKEGLPPTVRWIPERTISLPIQVESGTISLNEAIVNNILANDFTCQWKLFPNGFLALDAMQMAVASGTVTGQLSLSPSQRNTLSMKIMAEHVKANALARALLNAPNQVFGNLTGGIEFSTYGYSPVAMVQHANGKASFVIAQGRVPSLDKVERLLSTANVVRGGLLGLNASNLAFSIKGASRANSLRAISGDFQIVDGQLLTRNFLSDSKNLDLAMSGGVRLDNGIADLTIIGIMPQTVVSNSKFAKLGSLSLGQLFEYVPVLGYLPVGKNKKGLFDFIPGLGYIPGLGGVPGKTNSFQAQLKGPPDDPTSIKQLRWLRQSVVPKKAVSVPPSP